jgi:hypothetical protein
MTEGPQFSSIEPKSDQGLLSSTSITIPVGDGLEYGVITQVTPLDAFRVGQQIWFNLQIGQVAAGSQSWISRVRLRPWWLTENIEFRPPGSSGGWIGPDQAAFSGGQVANNRYAWSESPKRLDQSPYGSTPPVVSPVRMSDSIFLADLWTIDMDDPNNPLWTASLLAGQTQLRRSLSFYYPAHGVALGFTCEITSGGLAAPITTVPIYLKWKTGATHSNAQESID